MKAKPVSAVNTVTALLYRPENPLTLIVRENSTGDRYGFIGGKLEVREALTARVLEELKQEAELEHVEDLRPISTLYLPNRKIEYPRSKWSALGYATEILERDCESLLIANQLVVVFAGWTREPVPQHLIEGRKITELNISGERGLASLKKRHRIIASAWREYVLRGVPIPPLLAHGSVRSGEARRPGTVTMLPMHGRKAAQFG